MSTYLVQGTNAPLGTSLVGTSPGVMTLIVPGGLTTAASFASLVGGTPSLTLVSSPTADVIITSAVPSQVGSGQITNEALYAAALPAFCAAHGCVFVDIFNMWGGINGWATLNPAGYYGFLGTSVHPSAQGYGDLGRLQVQGMLGA